MKHGLLRLTGFMCASAILSACASVASKELGAAAESRKAGNCQAEIDHLTKAYQQAEPVDSWGLSMSSVAARDLAGMYWQGRCVSRNKDLARLWYEREAAFGGVGPADAQEHLACIDQPSSPDCSGSEAWAARGGRNYAQATLIEKCETAIDNNNWQQFADLGCPQPQTPNPGPSSRETLSALLTGVTQGMNQVAAARNQNRGSTSAIATYDLTP